jgi:isoleucyl-tRNA synthetase
LVTYANIDGWAPEQDDDFDPAFPEGSAPHSESLSLLDRWILGRLNQVVQTTTNSLANSDTLTATIAVESFLDDLTNWYVRRSRRRFWKSEHDEDKNTAYATLYHILVKLAKLLSPFVPFITEAIYQNLVRSIYPQAYESIHHCTWPEYDPAMVDETIIDQMELARQLASVGLSARNSAGIKVRQPLGKALAHVDGKRTLSDEYVEIVTDELNVKGFEFVEDASQLVTYQVLPDNKKLGPRFGAQFPTVRAALESAEVDYVVSNVQANLPIDLQVDGEMITLEPDEILVQTKPVEGLITAEDKQITVALDVEITPELRAEGLAREIVRRIQAMRKNADFNI